jgi:uroporphyrinogen-III synthase
VDHGSVTFGPLSGFTIGVTADRRSDEQIRLLSGRGATCIHGPAIKTHPLGNDDDLRRATLELIEQPADIVILATAIGVRSWLEAAEVMHLADDLRATLGRAELVARGAKAVGSLVTAGFEVSWNAPNARYDDIVAMLAERGVEGVRVAVQLDGAVDAHLCRRIAELGADILPVPVYRWSQPLDREPVERLIAATCDGKIDGLTFTARPAVENFLAIARETGRFEDLVDALATTAYFCVGPVCAAGFTDVGLDRPIFPERTRLSAMVQQVTRYFATESRELPIGGVPVRVQGRQVQVDGGHPVVLSDRERTLLAVLLEGAGAVHSKRDLLRRVWGPNETDTHVVEVTIARLRSRLGPAGPGVETVIRRGYRVSTT